MWRHLVQLVFPDFCLQCGRLGPLLCEQCRHGLEFYFDQPQLNNLDQVYLNELQIMAKFQPPLSTLVKALKYQHAKNTARLLATLLCQHCRLPVVDLITFVPIHPRKERQRFYNQCQEVALELGKMMGVRVAAALLRRRHQTAQARISDQQTRLTRLAGSFTIASPQIQQLVAGKRILLLDDVLTTGTTLNENAKILQQAGAAWVAGLTIASKKS